MPSVPASEVVAVRHARMSASLAATGRCSQRTDDVVGAILDIWEQPGAVASALNRALGVAGGTIVTGPIANRLIVLPAVAGWVVVTFGQKTPRDLPFWDAAGVEPTFEGPDAVVWMGSLSEAVVHRLTRPRASLVALYHPEVFPLPRFALGIADVASAIRRTYQGTVRLHDMQLGASLEQVLRDVEAENPDIVGISATFGQNELLQRALHRLSSLGGRRIIVAGGSLSALNAEAILDGHPGVFVASGPGEATAQDLVGYWHGDIPLEKVRDLKFRSAKRRRVTGSLSLLGGPSQRPRNRALPSILPELDLLDATLNRNGVMQLESSRGCTHACSFCPREHKGLWHGDVPESLSEVLPDIDRIFLRYPRTARKVFLVDEEFIGLSADEDPLRRASAVVARLQGSGFRWEANTRVDQVHRPDRDRAWNLTRIDFWDRMRDAGLDRCLFGVESGVDSILRRFNKRTSAKQNVTAVRTLTALGIPIRCTYITFDPLMTLEELHATYQFQARTDLILRKVRPGMPLAELVDCVQDDAFVAENSVGLPFYTHISYMLVSMECLIGSPYLKKVEAEGLAREVVYSMGRRNAEYKDWRVGQLSVWGQRWVDRNFSLDYTLKSLEKLSMGEEKEAIRRVRFVLRRSAYELLGSSLRLVADLGKREVDGAGGLRRRGRLRCHLRAIRAE